MKITTQSYHDLEGHMLDVQQLVCALQIINWQFSQEEIREVGLSEIRSGVIGIGDAMERIMKEWNAGLGMGDHTPFAVARNQEVQA